MHEDSTSIFEKHPLLTIFGGFALLAVAAAVWSAHSLTIVNLMLWPFYMLAIAANLKPGDIDLSAVLMLFLVGSLALSVLAMLVLTVVTEFKRRPH